MNKNIKKGLKNIKNNIIELFNILFGVALMIVIFVWAITGFGTYLVVIVWQEYGSFFGTIVLILNIIIIIKFLSTDWSKI